MRYVITLIIGLASIGMIVFGPFNSVYAYLRNKTIEVVSPPSKSEKMLDQLQERQRILGAYFGQASANISKNTSAKERETIKQAAEIFKESESLVAELQQQIQEDQPGIIQTIVKKLIPDQKPGPTSIPPQCELVCK